MAVEVKTEGNYLPDWLKWEQDNLQMFSRKVVTVKSGANLVSGQVLKADGADVVAITADNDSVIGILLFDVDATAAAKKGVMIHTDAIVDGSNLTLFANSTAGNLTAVLALLAALRIKAASMA